MHRSSILWILCVAMASACVVTTKKEPVVRDHRTAPPPEEEPPPPVVRDHRTHRPEPPPPEPTPPPPVVRDHRTHEPEPPPPVVRDHRGGWVSRGWTLLGEKWVSGKNDFIPVGERKGPFTKLMMVVEEGDLELTYLIVEYDNGRKHSPKVQHRFAEGQRTQPLDLRGEARFIRRIELRYANVGAGRRAKVQIWGREG